MRLGFSKEAVVQPPPHLIDAAGVYKLQAIASGASGASLVSNLLQEPQFKHPLLSVN